MLNKPIGTGEYTNDDQAKAEYIYVLPKTGWTYPEAHTTLVVREGLNVDLDSHGHIIGVEILS